MANVRSVRGPVLHAALAALAVASCAHQAGKAVTGGAVSELEKPAEDKGETKGADVSEDVGRGVVRGILEGLGEPEGRAQLGAVTAEVARGALQGATGFAPGGGRGSGVGGSGSGATASSPVSIFGDQFATAFAAAFSREMMQQLGDGDGPLSRSLAASTQRIAAAAVASIREELGPPFPECRGADRQACVNKRISEISGAASTGVWSGSATTVLLVVIAFLTGALVAVVTVALVSRRGVGRAEARA